MLILVRHGQSESNAAGLLAGRADVPLTELGRVQARQVASALGAERERERGRSGSGGLSAGPGPLKLLTSPLRRAVETADAIALAVSSEDVTVARVVDERLIELDYGEFDGRRPTDIDPDVWATWQSDPSWKPPGGESFDELHSRLDPLWAEVVPDAASGDVIAVSHVSPIKAGVAWAIGAGPELAWRLSLGVCAVTRIRTTGGRPALVSFGETGHLRVGRLD